MVFCGWGKLVDQSFLWWFVVRGTVLTAIKFLAFGFYWQDRGLLGARVLFVAGGICSWWYGGRSYTINGAQRHHRGVLRFPKELWVVCRRQKMP